jgi:signal transduction histidine kinase
MVWMTASPDPSRSASAAAAPKRAAVGGPSDIWVRTLPAWHAWNIGVILVATAAAEASWTMTPPARAASLGLATTLLVLYVVMFMRRPREWGYWWPRGVPYAVAVTVCFALLLQLDPYFAYLAFTIYPQIFFMLYARRRALLTGAAGIAVALTLGEVTTYGGLDGAAPHLLADYAQIGFSFAIALWIGAMAKQSIERRMLIDELETTRRELAAVERQAGVMEERSRLAREIHDTLAQGFASVVAHLEAAKGSLDHDPERVARHIESAEEVARRSLADARGLAWALRPEALSAGGLAGALERTIASTFKGTTVGISLTVTGEVRGLHPNVEVTLLRAAQEALANARRHAAPHYVAVSLSFFDDTVTLDIADDGTGFDPEPIVPGPAGGLGLLGIRERVEAIGGEVSIESTVGHGTTIGVSVPTLPKVPPAAESRLEPAAAGAGPEAAQ